MPIAITPKTPEAPVVSKNTKPYYEGSTKTPSESSSGALVPSFSHSVIENNRSDGYWVETFNFSKKEKVPGVIVSGLVSGIVEFLDNPIAAAEYKAKCGGRVTTKPDINKPWEKYVIGKFDSPVAVVIADVNGNGLNDVIICHDYGPFMLECNPIGGHITWLENPGREGLGNGPWKQRYIGRWPAMHRIKAGYFTQKTYLEVVAASVVYGRHDKTTPIPIILFQAPELVEEAAEWPRSIIDDKNFTVIHEVTQKKFDGPNGLDSMIISSREGTTWLHYEENEWKRELIGAGEPKGPHQSPTSESPGSGDHWGSGCADVGKVGDDPFAYVATLDPFHGTTACVYTKTNRGLQGNQWKRHVLDVYGTPNQLLHTGDGPGHYIVCADFDGDGDDEFLLALFGSLDRDEEGNSIPPQAGPGPNKGIMYYKAVDLENGIFTKWKIGEESSARIAIGNFAGKDRIDFASMGYNVARYYEEPKPVVTIHPNEFAPPKKSTKPKAITPTVWADEGLIYLAKPDTIDQPASLPLIEIANYALSIEVYPAKRDPKDASEPSVPIPIRPGEGLKVLYGSIANGDDVRRPLGVKGFPGSASTESSTASSFTPDATLGAIVLRLTPTTTTEQTWARTEDVPVTTLFNASEYGLSLPPQSFQKVDTLWWGKPFAGREFYNLSGFHFRFLESKEAIAHLQFWTAGTDVNCGVHNHSDNIFEEVHICLSAGTRNGGMSRLKDAYLPPNSNGGGPVDADALQNLPAEAFDHLALKRLHEHGGMWVRNYDGSAARGKNNVVVYPWHKWQAGEAKGVDVWLALEFNPDLEL